MAKKQKSRLVFVTGGKGSVRRALVEAFTRNGDKVVFQYFAGQRMASQLRRRFGAGPVKLDFTKDFQLPDRTFDVVINNAGVNVSDAKTHKVTLEDWDLTLRVNLTAPFTIV